MDNRSQRADESARRISAGSVCKSEEQSDRTRRAKRENDDSSGNDDGSNVTAVVVAIKTHENPSKLWQIREVSASVLIEFESGCLQKLRIRMSAENSSVSSKFEF